MLTHQDNRPRPPDRPDDADPDALPEDEPEGGARRAGYAIEGLDPVSEEVAPLLSHWAEGRQQAPVAAARATSAQDPGDALSLWLNQLAAPRAEDGPWGDPFDGWQHEQAPAPVAAPPVRPPPASAPAARARPPAPDDEDDGSWSPVANEEGPALAGPAPRPWAPGAGPGGAFGWGAPLAARLGRPDAALPDDDDPEDDRS